MYSGNLRPHPAATSSATRPPPAPAHAPATQAWASCAAGRGRQTWSTCSRRWRRAAAPPSPTTSPSPRRPTTPRRGSARAACRSATSATRRWVGRSASRGVAQRTGRLDRPALRFRTRALDIFVRASYVCKTSQVCAFPTQVDTLRGAQTVALMELLGLPYNLDHSELHGGPGGPPPGAGGGERGREGGGGARNIGRIDFGGTASRGVCKTGRAWVPYVCCCWCYDGMGKGKR